MGIDHCFAYVGVPQQLLQYGNVFCLPNILFYYQRAFLINCKSDML